MKEKIIEILKSKIKIKSTVMTDYCDPHIKSDITGFEQAAQEISALLKGEDKLSLEKDRVIKVLKKHQHIRYSENRTAYGVFDIDYESIASELCTGESDNEILFHECPSCNSRCNCSDQPCSCCSTDIKDDKITDAFCKTRDEDITGNLHYRDRDYFQAGYDFGISDKDAIIEKLNELNKLRKSYIVFLGEQLSDNAAFLKAHGIVCSETDFKIGAEYHKQIEHFELELANLKKQ